MKFILLAITTLLFATPSQAQGTPECYVNFGGRPGGKACCDQSYARNARGSLPNAQRMSGLEACVARAEKKGKK